MRSRSAATCCSAPTFTSRRALQGHARSHPPPPTLPRGGSCRRRSPTRLHREFSHVCHEPCRNGDNSSMFTGIVRERGRIAAVEGDDDGIRLIVEAPATAAQAALGDSIAVSGVCLTVVAADNGALAFDAVPETLRRSS